MAPVEFRDLRKRFGSVEAVKGLTFEVEAGRVTGFLGPNGAGKSTSLRALLGLATSAPSSRTPPSPPAAAGATTCASSPPPGSTRPGASTRFCRWSGSPRRPTAG